MHSTTTLLAACAALFLAFGCASSEDVDSAEGALTGPAATPEEKPTKPLGPMSATCTTSEELVFSCTTIDEQKIAICASKDLSATAGYLQARVEGKTGVEISVPADAARTTFRTDARVVTTERGTYLQYEDKDNRRSYVVYQALGDKPRAGISVSVSGKPKDHLVCLPGFVSKLGKPLFDKGGLKYSKDEPRLPPAP